MSVSVSIGALAIHGLPPAAQRRCADAFQGELERLMAAEPPKGGGDTPLRLSYDPREGTAAGLGIAAARSLHAALTVERGG